MSRHRRVRNMSYGEGKLDLVYYSGGRKSLEPGALFVDDDYYEYGRSVEEDVPLSPDTAGKMSDP